MLSIDHMPRQSLITKTAIIHSNFNVFRVWMQC